MKKCKLFHIVSLCLFFSLAFGCGKEPRQGHVEEIMVDSAAIADNTVGEDGRKTINVFLPPRYDAGDQRYPVLYYLHGYNADSREMLGFEFTLYQAMEEGKTAPFILVAVNGNNALDGSFYVNSKNGGRWEDHITDELVPLIDKSYRTLAVARSRGLMGFSMGGFGALHLGLAHPDIFASIWALSPGVFVPKKGLADAVRQWKAFGDMTSLMDAYALAFSREKKAPLLDGSAKDNAVAAEWEAGYGNWDGRIRSYKKSGVSLKGIRIVYGEADQFRWITEGAAYLADLLQKEGLPAEIQSYVMPHSIRPDTVRDDALPFFERTLAR